MKSSAPTSVTAAADKIDLANELARWRRVIDNAQSDFFSSHLANGGLQLGKEELECFSALSEYTQRSGKRIRGGLAMFAYERLGGKKKAVGLKLGVAIELIQNYFLIIDDVMDRSNIRRGKPTLHKIFSHQLATKLSSDEAEHQGEMLAINVGIIAQHLASRLLAEVDEDPARVSQATQVFHRNVLGTCYGQIGDIYSSVNRSAKEEDLIRTHTLKNSYYTFINPLQVAAILAGKGDEQTLEHLEAIGVPAGVAFQLQDDILGLFGDEKLTGKPNFDDLKEGKFTLLMSHAFAKASKHQLKTLRSALGNQQLDAKLVDEVRQIVEETGALKDCANTATKYCQAAQQEIAASRLFDQAGKDFLTELITYTIDRKV